MVNFFNKNKELLTNLLIIFAFAIIIILSMSNSKTLNYDTIWCFHASQKVASGYTMYSQINTVLTPIFFWVGALFIKVFGNAVTSLYICSGIIGGVLISTVHNILKKVDKEKSGILFLAFICLILKNIYIIAAPSYNILALMWWLLAVFLELKNNNDEKGVVKRNILIGVLTALTIFTKQSIGVFAFISTIVISLLKSKKIKKEILAKILGMLIIILIMLMYFIYTGSFIEFLNFCIGGLFDFGTQNAIVQIPIMYTLIILLTVLGVIFWRKKQDKNLIVLTVTQISMISLIFPVANTYHIVLSMLISIPLFGICMKYIENKELQKIIFMILVFCMLCIQKGSRVRDYSLVENLFVGELFASELILTALLICFGGLIITILFEKKNVIKYLIIGIAVFLISTQLIVNKELKKDEILSVDLKVYKGLNLDEEACNYLNNILKYIKDKEKEGKRVLIVSADSSYYMAPLERNNYLYDFALHGSLGIRGEEILIDNLPKDDNLILMKNKYMMYQESNLLDKFIKENFEKNDEIYDLEVYQKNN